MELLLLLLLLLLQHIVLLALLCGGDLEDTALPARCKHGGHAQGASRAADSEVRVVSSSQELVWSCPRHPVKDFRRSLDRQHQTSRFHEGRGFIQVGG